MNAKKPLKTYINLPASEGEGQHFQYDYTNQAWLEDGVYKRCSHPAKMGCQCYGRLHAGEPPAEGAEIH